MFNAIVQFSMQLSLLYLLITAFLLTALLLGAVRARRLREERESREAERSRARARRDRRPIGDRPSIPARIPHPPASLAPIPIHRKATRKPFGQQAVQ